MSTSCQEGDQRSSPNDYGTADPVGPAVPCMRRPLPPPVQQPLTLSGKRLFLTFLPFCPFRFITEDSGPLQRFLELTRRPFFAPPSMRRMNLVAGTSGVLLNTVLIPPFLEVITPRS